MPDKMASPPYNFFFGLGIDSGKRSLVQVRVSAIATSCPFFPCASMTSGPTVQAQPEIWSSLLLYQLPFLDPIEIEVRWDVVGFAYLRLTIDIFSAMALQ